MAIPLGTTAVNPANGHRIVLTEKGWVALNTPQMQLPEADAQSMQGLQQQAQDAQYLDQKGQQFLKAMDPQHPGQGGFATGPAYFGGVTIPFTHGSEIPNPLPTIVGGVDPRVGDLQSITNQAWVHMRPQGSGAIRGYEASAFKEAFPGLEHWGPENQRIAARLHQDALIATQKLDFIDNFIRSGRGDYAAANAAWAALGAGMGTPVGQSQPPPAIPPPMQMVPDPNSPIGARPAPGVAPPPPAQQTPQQTAILNWTPDKGLQP